MDNSQAPAIRQRRDPSAALGRHRQRQPVQGGQDARHLETPASQLLLRLCAVLDPGQELLGAGGYHGGEERAYKYVEYLLSQPG
ncbi:hypothetical protein NPX13_g10133 [Xylaria arbuscula]|uniref:Uncharacterized protein n=1 Tax=Xylaria arbuscula TaxID=114810 RepID=A0A9W8N5E6_9PEZI|nr:hypothetical protein NPX13_g10133 [Xylaria arbuscula]